MKPHKHAEVIHAFAEGKEVQWRQNSDSRWEDTLVPGFSECLEWRIKPSEFPAPPKECQWHNPHNLTPEQVEVEDGWRLLLRSEIDYSASGKNDCQKWHDTRREWMEDMRGNHGRFSTDTYRTNRLLPEPKKLPEKQPYTQESWQFEWVKMPHRDTHYRVLAVMPEGIRYGDLHGLQQEFYCSIKEWEGSNDRVNWLPLYR